MRKFNNILVTGGCGFIGSNFIRHLFRKKDFSGNIINVDNLSYAGNPNNLIDIRKNYRDRYFFEHVNIFNYQALEEVFEKYNIDVIVHFAAESHVDRSIDGPREFIESNIVGTFNLLELSRKKCKKDFLFHHISTDEVYGSLEDEGYFFENTAYDPRSPYSASKAASDHLVRSYFHTYNMNITISNCSNNYGPYQYPEKLIPLIINNILEEKELPIYGDGLNIRDWLFVDDHCEAIYKIIKSGKIGSSYNIGGENEWTNIDLVNKLCEIIANRFNKEKNYYKKLIKFVKDRAGHDRRYAINCDKIKKELSWKQSLDFEKGLNLTVDWYLSNKAWLDDIKNRK